MMSLYFMPVSLRHERQNVVALPPSADAMCPAPVGGAALRVKAQHGAGELLWCAEADSQQRGKVLFLCLFVLGTTSNHGQHHKE